jgi:CRISPR-associated protein Cas6
MGEGRSDAGVMASDDEVVDLVFALRGRAIALDYADRLWEGLRERLRWLDQLELVGVHPLAGVSPGDSELYLTRRARLALRLPVGCGDAARALTGSRLELGGEVEVGTLTQRALTPTKVLYSSFVTMGESDEQGFMVACREALAVAGIAGHLVCGKARRAAGAHREWRGFSLMLHGLTERDSLRLQRNGLGDERQRGCGIFVPHKAVAVVED